MINDIPDRRTLRRLAGARSFERGEAYFAGGQVRSVLEHEGTITANVQGARRYRVKLWEEGGDLLYSCSCPVGTDGAFCKHCVAVGLALLKPRETVKSPERRRGKPAVTMDDVRAYLAGQDKNALVTLLMDQPMDDDRLRQRLLLRAAKRGPRGFDVATYRQAIDHAVDPRGFVEYREAYDYAQRIDEAVDSIEEILKEGHAAEVIELTEHALEAVERAMESVDDSDGHIGAILEQYRTLKRHADRVGQWQEWRQKALEFSRETIAKAKRENRPDRWDWSRRTGHSELVRVFLWEKNVEAAWREAQEGGCSTDLWLELAAKREADHPADVLPIYQRQIEPTLNQKNNDAYRDAIGLLRKVRGLMVRLGRGAEFEGYLESIRGAHKPKRNFVRLLDRARWS